VLHATDRYSILVSVKCLSPLTNCAAIVFTGHEALES
jgi:hypothetical protein